MSTRTQEPDAPFGRYAEPTTLTIVRRLPGPAERVWRHLTDPALRRQWLADGAMPPEAGTSFELVWRNDTLSATPAERPEGFGPESRATCRLVEFDAPRRLRFEWPGVGEVAFELEPKGEDVLLTVVHRRLPDRDTAVGVGAGWHAHLDVLAARMRGTTPPSFWAHWRALREDYADRAPG